MTSEKAPPDNLRLSGLTLGGRPDGMTPPGSYLDPEGELQRILGPGHEIVKVEKDERVHESESTLLVNGHQVHLEGQEGSRIRECLLRGVMPDQQLINHILTKAGLILRPNLKHLVSTEMQVSRTETCSKTVMINKAGSPPIGYSEQHQQTSSVSGHRVTTTSPPLNGIRRDAKTREELEEMQKPKTFLQVLQMVLNKTDDGVKEEEDKDFSLLLWSRWHLKVTDLLNFLLKQQAIMRNSSKSNSRMSRFIRRWVKWFPTDFKDEPSMQSLRLLCSQLSEQVSPHLLTTLSSHLAVISRHKGYLQDYSSSIKDEAPEEVLSQFVHECPLGIARELTRIELDYLSFLGPEEFLNSLAKEGKSKAKQDSFGPTDNLDNYTAWFNHLTYLVVTTVCKIKRKKSRVRLVRQWIEVARQCVNIGNFNSLMGIITGLNMAPVARMTKTWESVHSEKFSVLEHQMDPSSNFSSYRSTLTAAIARSEVATDDRARSVVPFLSLFKKDLFVAREKYLNSLEDRDHFDLAGASAVSIPLKEFVERKESSSCCCPYTADQKASAILRTKVLTSDDDLDLASYHSEPPRNSMEKRRYKELKKDLGRKS